MKIPLLYELKCKCGRYFLYCLRRGPDFRCDKCKQGMTLEEVEAELENMDPEEYDSFMKDIEEYKEEIHEQSKLQKDSKEK